MNLSPFSAIMVMLNVPTDHGAAGGTHVVISYEQGRWEPTFILHEMGHAVGLNHSWSANPDTVYGDRWDIMSAMNVWRFPGSFDEGVVAMSGPGLNAPNLARLGAVPASRIWTADIGGNPTLAALNHPEATGYLMARLDPGPLTQLSSTYTVELRQKDGWDLGIPRNAVLVHEVRADGRSFLLSAPLLSSGTRSDLQTGDSITLEGAVQILVVHARPCSAG